MLLASQRVLNVIEKLNHVMLLECTQYHGAIIQMSYGVPGSAMINGGNVIKYYVSIHLFEENIAKAMDQMIAGFCKDTGKEFDHYWPVSITVRKQGPVTHYDFEVWYD